MMLFWWQGKGYLTPIIVMLSLMAFGLLLQAGRPTLHDAPWLWGSALIVAAGINWRLGRQRNAKKIAAVRSLRWRDTLIYPARNRFMSLPFETWSIPLGAVGVGAIIYSILSERF